MVSKLRSHRDIEYIALTHPKVRAYAEAELQKVAELGRSSWDGIIVLKRLKVPSLAFDGFESVFVHAVYQIVGRHDADALEVLAQAYFEGLHRTFASQALLAETPPALIAPDMVPFDHQKEKSKSLRLMREDLEQIIKPKYLGQQRKRNIQATHTLHDAAFWLLDAFSGWTVKAVYQRQDILRHDSRHNALGRPDIAFDKKAPSRAYRKVLEAFDWLNVRLTGDDHVVDLGGSPGGWSHQCLKAEARVVLVDRGDIDETLLLQPRFTWEKKDAFTYVLPEDTTWLLSDIIDRPERLLSYLDERLPLQPKLKGGVITLKLQPDDTYSYVKKLKADAARICKAHGFDAYFRHLYYNKGEFTLGFLKAET